MVIKNIEHIYPLSYVQQSLLADELGASTDRPACRVFTCRMEGELHLPAFESAWRQVVRQHALLRTSFIWKRQPQFLQLVHKEVELRLHHLDWRALSVAEQHEQLESLAKEKRHGCDFELTSVPLMRWTLCRTADDTHYFFWQYHPLLLDEPSVVFILKEVFTLYEGFCAGGNQQSADDHSFHNYVSRLHQHDLSAAESFWRETLKGLNTPTLPGIDSSSSSSAGDSADTDAAFSERQLTLSPVAVAALARLARARGLQLGVIVAGAWAALLSRYSGEQEVTFGLTVAGRLGDCRESEIIVGPVQNTLPWRIEVSTNMDWWTWLEELENWQKEAGRYAYCSVKQYREWSDIPAHLPLFACSFEYGGATIDELDGSAGGALRISGAQLYGPLPSPLHLHVTEDSGLTLKLRFESKRFEQLSIERMLNRLQTSLEAISTGAAYTPANLPALTERELRLLLVEWNETTTDYPREHCVHQLFEQQVERMPQAIALLHRDQSVTYGELNERANRLAHYLLNLGVGPEVPVGICVEPSFEMVVGLLGILKAGGAYVPLDPAHPLERLAYVQTETGMPVLLTVDSLMEKLPVGWAMVVSLDGDWEAIALECADNPTSAGGAEHLAYVMHTSGSTGKPKGVGVTHRGIVRLVKNTNYIQLSPEDTLLQYAPLAFDASTFEIWGSLLNGARLVIAPERTLSLEELGQALEQYGVTILWITAGLFHQMVEGRLDSFVNLRHLLAGGDVVSPSHASKFMEAARGCRLTNGYGPTENTTFTCCHDIMDSADAGASVPIGTPISNTQVYVLDRHLRLVPPGLPGELYCAGDGLARGYFNQPDLTAEKFIPHPFSERAGQRLYRSGDLVRHRADGKLEFLARIDEQVKIRGFRIEPGEVEAFAAQHPALKQAVVVGRADHTGEKRLVLYGVLAAGQSLDVGELRRFLRDKLPEFMLPSAFVALSEIPLTPNGKIDRRALPDPETSTAEQPDNFEPPRTPVEEAVAKMLAELLQVDRVGVNANFFDLGAHSLLLTQLCSRLRDAFDIELPLRVVLENPSVAELSGVVEQTLFEEIENLSEAETQNALQNSGGGIER
jgi:amino acid adenylation domain-containing protein